MGVSMRATTESGAMVVLNDDGTWATEPSPMAGNPAQLALGFRKVPWGATMSEIKASEVQQPDHEDEDSLGFNTVLAGLQAIVFYILIEDQLVRAKYIITQEYQNKNSYITAFSTLKEALTSKYGVSGESNIYWNDDLYEDDPTEWGMAISLGHHSRFETWANENTSICLALTGENYDIQLVVEYTGIALRDIESDHRKASLLADL